MKIISPHQGQVNKILSLARFTLPEPGFLGRALPSLSVLSFLATAGGPAGPRPSFSLAHSVGEVAK